MFDEKEKDGGWQEVNFLVVLKYLIIDVIFIQSFTMDARKTFRQNVHGVGVMQK